ncbi:SGNH/GDSL hydrolase family protein [Sphingomonas sp. Leaf343]|uniref:SGNH/GDSL hydrolase family protein n=1 Tax=Sphingomonas sp. Leaf343 TaxID=1736345 RepID=UPI0006FA83A3|nr:SGNH/GDSL hydrolase family protein [Sphingomonas sp. Leaf343]
MASGTLERVIAATALILAAPASAQGYSNLFVFGDSLVDGGNAQKFRRDVRGADPAPTAAGYFRGRFSNGFTFADYVGRAVDGGPAVASEYGGRNYSVGGAQAREVIGDASPSFAEQIALYDASANVFDSRSLVLITLGGNDVRSELERVATIPGYRPGFDATLGAMTDGLASLYARGARNFIVTGLPDIGQIPVVTQLGLPTLSAIGTGLSFNLNMAFEGLVGSFAAATGSNARFFDLFDFQRTIYADPARYGLPTMLDTGRACLQAPGAAPACDGFVYFDTIHPTTQIHRAIGRGLTDQLGLAAVPEPMTWAMMIVGVALTGGALRHRRRRTTVAFG